MTGWTLIAASAPLGIGPLRSVVYRADEFDVAKVMFERNAADQDVEMESDSMGGRSAGLSGLKVVASDGRSAVDLKTPGSKPTVRRISFESPDPNDDGKLQAELPAGSCVFVSTGGGVDLLDGQATPSRAFPESATHVHPRRDWRNLPIKRLMITWRASTGPSDCTVVIEPDGAGHEISADHFGDASSYAVPDELRPPDNDYKIASGAAATDGNRSFAEASFSTAREQRAT